MDDFAHGTHFSGEFLREWYPPSLVVDMEKLALVKTLRVKTHTSYNIPISQQKIDPYARNQLCVPIGMSLPVWPASLQTRSFLFNHVLHRSENQHMDNQGERNKKPQGRQNVWVVNVLLEANMMKR